MKDKVIMLCSPLAGQGKDSCFNIMSEIFDTKRVAFADKIKEIATLMGWDGKKDEKGRKLLINLGTHAGREYDKDMWVKLGAIKVEELLKNKQIPTITDLRFVSEVEFFKNKFGENNVIVIGIESDIFGDQSLKDDATQKEYIDIKKDYIIKNNGTMDELEEEIVKVMRDIYINK